MQEYGRRGVRGRMEGHLIRVCDLSLACLMRPQLVMKLVHLRIERSISAEQIDFSCVSPRRSVNIQKVRGLFGIYIVWNCL